MEMIDSEFQKMLESNPEQNLHTQIPTTGYQPYGDRKVGSVAETSRYGPVMKSGSSGSQQSSRSSSIAKRKAEQSDPLESGSVALTPSVLVNGLAPLREDYMLSVNDLQMDGQLSSGTVAVTL